MESLKTSIKAMLDKQETRITAALQLILCFLAITLTVRNEFHTNQKKRGKADRRKNR